MKLLVFAGLIALAYAKHEQYAGWKSYFVAPSTTEQVKSLHDISEEYHLDFLSHALVEREGVVLVKPEFQEGFTQALEKMGVSYRIHADDVKAQLENDDARMEAWSKVSFARNGGQRMPYDDYQRLDVIYAYMDDIAARFPDTVTLVTPAESFEGRPIKYLKISTTNFEDTSKPVIFVDGGIHAREWISPPSVTYMIKKLTEDVDDAELLEKYDWILMPVVNPDGYEFTHTNSRFWRKTRSTNTNPLSTLCPGVDGNRNYDFYWNTVGTSNSACSDIYAGNQPFSEIETRVVRDLLHEHLARIAMYLTMHSYGSMILYGWGHDGSLSHNAFALHSVGVSMASVIDSLSLPNFPNYVVGNSALVLSYAAAGASEDYAHHIGVPLSYTYELPGLDWGMFGFHLDPIYIEQVCRETWEGVAVGVKRAGALMSKRSMQ